MFSCFRPRELPTATGRRKGDFEGKDGHRTTTGSSVSSDYNRVSDPPLKPFDDSKAVHTQLPELARASPQLVSLPFTALNASEASQLNQALSMVQNMVQKFAELRQESASLRSLQQALTLVTREWPGALARLHVATRENALLLAMAPRAVAPPVHNARTSASSKLQHNSGGQHPLPPSNESLALPVILPVRDHLLVSLAQPGLAMSAALDSGDGCFCWMRGDGGDDDAAPPLDYEAYAAAGAQAIFSVVVKLTGTTGHNAAAVLTLAFPHCPGHSRETHVELWTTYVRLIASGLATLFVGSLAPRYLLVALELSEACSLDAAMAAIVRRLRELSGQAGNTQLWFRVALIPPYSPGHAVLFDLPSEVLPALCSRRPSSALDSSYMNCVMPPPLPTRRGPGSRDGSLKGSACGGGPLGSGLNRASSTPSKLPNHLFCNPSSGVLRTIVTTPHTLLRHVVDRCQQVVVPDLQKLLNQGGMVAADIFSVHEVRPPASVLLLPLVRAGEDGHADLCFGGVYCMSGVLTDFADVKQHLCEAIVEVLSPHLLAAISREPLATEYLNSRVQSHTLSMSDRATSLDTLAAEQLGMRLTGQAARNRGDGSSSKDGGSKDGLSLTPDGGGGGMQPSSSSPQAALAAAAGQHRNHRRSSGATDRTPIMSPPASVAGSGTGNAVAWAANGSGAANGGGQMSDSMMGLDGNGVVASGGGGGSNRSSCTGNAISCPASYTNALVTGLTDKISMHRTIQSMDAASTSSLADLQFLGLLGTGGFGYVFQGKWCGIMVAIKLVKCPKMDEGADRAALKHAHEIAILSSVSHPNIIQAYAFMTDVKVSDVVEVCVRNSSRKLREDVMFIELLGMDGDFCHIEVLELCDQGTVVDALQRGFFSGYALSPAEAATLASAGGSSARHVLQGGVLIFGDGSLTSDGKPSRPRQGGVYTPKMHTLLLSLVELASALAHLHSLGIVHCDIKPDNVLLKSSTIDARGFTLKLADFGLSRVQDDQCLTFPCNSCGTLAYVAPEALSNKKVDHSIDVYSFGILMYELYSNRRPYATTRQEELLHAVVVLGMRPVFRPGSHAGYVNLARACWDPVPTNRPHFNEIIAALNHMLTTFSNSVLMPTATVN